jgi:hypothetical protein
MRSDREHQEQSLLFQWAALATHRLPQLALLFAVPNWIGVRTRRQGGRLKAEGRKPGVPDVWLPVPRGQYIGLVGEMKIKPNRLTPEQERWLLALNDLGWKTHVWWSWEEAKTALEEYLAA